MCLYEYICMHVSLCVSMYMHLQYMTEFIYGLICSK